MKGLVLGGGGAKGGYHIGAWKALREMGIRFDAVTGTSVGALNGAFVVMDRFDEALEIWEQITPETVMEIDGQLFSDLLHFKWRPSRRQLESTLRWMEKQVKNRGISIEPLRRLATELVDESQMRSSAIRFGLVSYNITDLKPAEMLLEDIPDGELVNYLLASSYLPAFGTLSLEGKNYLDGGFYDNLPINLMSRMGIRDIIAVDLGALGIKRPVKDPEVSLTLIQPSGELGKLLDFDPQKSQRHIRMGYLDTLKVMGKLEGKKFFLEGVREESSFLDAMRNFTKEEIAELIAILGLEGPATHRYLFERIVPELVRVTGIESGMTYRDLMVSVLERVASRVEVERLEIYTFDELADLVLDQCLAKDDPRNAADLAERVRHFIRTFERQEKADRAGHHFVLLLYRHLKAL